VYSQPSNEAIAGLFVDLNADGIDEFVLLTPTGGLAFEDQAGHWELIGRVVAVNPGSWSTLLSDLASANVHTTVPRWRELSVGTRRFRVNEKAEQSTAVVSAVVH